MRYNTNYYIYLLLFIISYLNINEIKAQCNIQISANVKSVSTCPQNGVIQATLSGDLLNIDIDNASFGLVSLSGGQDKAFDKNGGIIINVGPGTYRVRARFFCKLSNSYQEIESAPLVVDGTYPGFDHSKIVVQTARVRGSLRCVPTGMIPINLESGLTPYKVTIIEAPDPALVDKSFTQAGVGVIEIEPLPPGNYKFAIEDACKYYYTVPATVPEIMQTMEVLSTTPSPLCETSGTISLDLRNGAVPYTIEILGPAYIGANPVIVDIDGTHIISGFGPGTYNLKIYDQCDTVFRTTIIDVASPSFSDIKIEPSLECIASGKISFFLSGGLEPYQVSIQGPPAYTGITDTIVNKGGLIFEDLPAGDYLFKVVDACGVEVEEIIAVTINPFKIDVDVTSASECGTKGSARIKVEGGASPYNFTILQGNIPSPNWNAPGTTILNNLEPGDYSIKVQDYCNTDTIINFKIKVSPPVIKHIVRKTLNCKNTGRITIAGNTYLIVKMTDSIGVNVSNIKKGNIVIFDSLPSGDFKFRIEDTCFHAESRIIHVDSIPVTQITNPYMDYFYPLFPNDVNCSRVQIKKREDGGNPIPEDARDIQYYWTDSAYIFFEVSWKTNTSNTWSPWEPVYNTKDTNFIMPLKYCELRDNDSLFFAKIRIEGTDPLVCDSVLDSIRFDKIQTNLSASAGGCDGFKFTFSQNTDNRGLICYPYKWTLTTENGVHVSGPNSENDASQVELLLHLGKYYISFEDGCGYQWKDSIQANWKNTSQFTINHSNFTCSSYDISFVNPQVCPPYSWVLKYLNDTIAHSGGNIFDVNLTQTVNKLLYDTIYQLIISQPGPQIDTILIQRSISPTSYTYNITTEGAYCLPDTARGSISIYRTSNAPFEEGTIIHYKNGPYTGSLEDTIRTKTLIRYFPFAPDSSFKSFLDLPPGKYEFELRDSCNRVYPLVVDYIPTTLVDFAYEMKPDCKGALIFPKGQIQFNGTNVNTYFHIIETPFGVADFTQTVQAGGSFLVQESGRYLLRVSNSNDYTSTCSFDTLSFDFTKVSFAIDSDSTQSYICEEGSGFISVRVKGGVGPFLFQLLDQGVKVAENYIGDFNYGVLGGFYEVRITDQGCGLSFTQPVDMLDLETAQLLSGTEKTCVGDTIKLNSISLGAYAVYEWTGPHGATWNRRNWRIPNADTIHSGTYTLVVQPNGCIGPTTQTMDVEVVYPAGPAIHSPVLLCLNSPEKELVAVPLPGYSVQWYAADTITPIPPPIPPTSAPDTFRYFVSQIYNALGCEGSRDPVLVIVSDLPTSVIGPYALDICAGTTPRLVIPNTIQDYTYNVYDNSDTTLMGTGHGTGDTIIIDCTLTLNASDTLLIETRNENNCPAIEYTKVGVIVVDANNDLVFGNDVCVGGTIELSSILLKTTPYWWTGPNGFTSNQQNPSIQDIQKIMSGIYTLNILPFGCTDSIRSSVDIQVIRPQAPRDTTIVLCESTPSTPLNISPTVGNSLRWYNASHVHLLSPPTPSTAVPDTFTYYITHLSDYLKCESDTATVTVIISALPQAVSGPYALDICAGTPPRIVLPNTSPDFTYNVYDRVGGTLMGSGIGTGDTIIIDCTVSLNSNATLIVETLNEHGCAARGYTEVAVIVVDVNDDLVFGNDVCVGGTIELSSILLKTTPYLWTGPNGFTSNEQKPSIPDAQKIMSGTYTLSIHPFGCTNKIQKSVDIQVIKPDAPNEPSPLIFCHLGPSTSLFVEPSVGNTIRWYNSLHTLLPGAPTPSTAQPDTLIYYITHISDYLNCESDPTPVRVIISRLPDPVEGVTAPDICPGISPTIHIPNTIATYMYAILLRPTDNLALVEEVSTGADLSLVVPMELYDTTTFYVRVSNEHACAVLNPTPITVNVVDYLYILPDVLPKYHRNHPYNQQLITNGAVPYSFTTQSMLPFGFNLSTSGLISGTSPRNGRIDPFPFTVHLRDADGCVKSKDYILKSETFVPEVFTPNEDGKNDIFMEGRRLIIFDRLGITIFEGDNGWNGTRNGEPAPSDTYFYILYYEENEDGTTNTGVEKTGYITLIRRR